MFYIYKLFGISPIIWSSILLHHVVSWSIMFEILFREDHNFGFSNFFLLGDCSALYVQGLIPQMCSHSHTYS